MHLAARASTLLFAGLAATMVAIKLLFDLYPGDFPVREQAAAFGWPLVAGMIGLGLAGLFADRAVRLPDPLSDARRERRGAVWAVLAGAAYGVITIGFAIYSPGENPLTQSGEWDHVAWPRSVPFYTFGAIFLEFLLRLGALCVLFWLVHGLILRGRLRALVFWSLAAVISAYEIWPYLSPDLEARPGPPRAVRDRAALPEQSVRGLAALEIRMVLAHRLPPELLPRLARALRRPGSTWLTSEIPQALPVWVEMAPAVMPSLASARLHLAS